MAQAGFTPIKLYLSTTAAAVPLAADLEPGELALNNNDGKLFYEDSSGVVQVIATKAGSSGDVVGPASATANAVPSFNGTTGKLIQNNSGVTIAAGVMTATGFAGSLNGTVGATTPATVVATQVDITAQGDLRLQDTTGGEYVALQAPTTVAVSYTLTLPVDDGTAGQALVTDGSGVLSWSTAASGDVYGPASATDNAIARFDLTTGKIIQNSVVTIADTTGNMAGVGTLSSGAITSSALTSGRVPFAGTAGLIQDSANLTFNGTTLTNTGNVIVSDSSANAALRITQVGAGNALLVEDSSNPDASPFVVDATGQVVIGNTTALTSVGGVNVSLQEHGLTSATSRIGLNNWGSGSTIQAGVVFAKSQSNVIGTQGIVSSGTQLGEIIFAGDDGAAFIPAASIRSLVNGTPGVNDMPGALIFSTTADGAAAVTERMRINAAGEALIGTASSPGVNLAIAKNITGAASATGVLSNGQLQVDVTSTAQYFVATSNQIVGSSVSQLRLFSALQGTLSGTVTNQYGFFTSSTLTSATNNYGFYSDIASGTGRWNFYASGTAANYFAGDMQLDTTVTAGGTTGAQTINKNAGTVNFAAAATSLVVTNSRVTTSSIIVCTVGTNDTTLKSVTAVAGAGSFTLHASAAATAETRVNFLIIN